MHDETLYETAKLAGYNQFDDVVYSKQLSLTAYYDGEHVWDSAETVLELNMTRLEGRLYDSTGKLTQQFESVFCPETGRYIGGRSRFDDGTMQVDGVLADD